MESENGLERVPLGSEVPKAMRAGALAPVDEAVSVVETLGCRVWGEWDPAVSVTPMGQWVYFAQFLATAGLFAEWVKDAITVRGVGHRHRTKSRRQSRGLQRRVQNGFPPTVLPKSTDA